MRISHALTADQGLWRDQDLGEQCHVTCDTERWSGKKEALHEFLHSLQERVPKSPGTQCRSIQTQDLLGGLPSKPRMSRPSVRRSWHSWAHQILPLLQDKMEGRLQQRLQATCEILCRYWQRKTPRMAWWVLILVAPYGLRARALLYELYTLYVVQCSVLK